ncbi:MAG: hypothetical protein LJE68_08550 [Rhodobacter sp.]|nr:hypothetical protein [Rhodobacter sp.]
MRVLTLICLFAATAASAQQGLRDSDVRLSKAELTEALSGKVLEFYSNGLATYQADGRYDYRYSADGERVPGRYQVKDGSEVCVAFDNGFERCDFVVQSSGRLVMVIFNGERYPVRTISAID